MHDNPNQYGLIGKTLKHSFSKDYFTKKFSENLFDDCTYQNFELNSIEEFPALVKSISNLKGLNVTIPYKESVIPYLDKLSKKAQQIQAVNVIKITKKGRLKGYNSDYFGFKKSLSTLIKPHHKKALMLGTGGASKAVAFALDELGILYTFVSRNPQEQNTIDYNMINQNTFENHQIIINTTPTGTSPNSEDCPPIPYQFFTDKHIAFDLIYNPSETKFLHNASQNGATIKNGLEMLQIQADKAWKIWNKT